MSHRLLSTPAARKKYRSTRRKDATLATARSQAQARAKSFAAQNNARLLAETRTRLEVRLAGEGFPPPATATPAS